MGSKKRLTSRCQSNQDVTNGLDEKNVKRQLYLTIESPKLKDSFNLTGSTKQLLQKCLSPHAAKEYESDEEKKVE